MNKPEFVMNANRKTAVVLTFFAALLSACASAPHTVTLARETVLYRCAGDVDLGVTYSGRATGMEGTADLIWDGKTFPLKQDVSGSGAQYTDGTLTLVTKGDEAFVEKAGEVVLKDCNAKPVTP